MTTVSFDLDGWLAAFVRPMDPDQPYREPTAAEAEAATAALWRLLGDGAADRLLIPLGFTIVRDVDAGRPFVLVHSEPPPGARAWGAVLVDAFAPARLVIGCPHPVHDRNTEQVGLALWRRTPGAVLLVAGAHRDAHSGEADPRSHVGSLFHRFAATLLRADLPHVQIHGFADAQGLDAVVSAGPGLVGVAHERAADAMAAAGLVVARAWLPGSRVPGLDGTTNVQAVAAAAAGVAFVHVETSTTARSAKRAAILDGLAAADVGRADHRHTDPPVVLAPAGPSGPTSWAVDAAGSVVGSVVGASVARTVDARLARSFALTAYGAVELAMAPGQAVDGATVTVEVVAEATPAAVTFAAPTTAVARARPPITIPAGKLALLTVRYSARVGRWVVVAADVEA